MKRALLVIDVQNEYFTGKLPVTYPESSFENIIKVIDFANENGIHVILIQHTSYGEEAITFKKETDEHEIHEEVLKRNHVKIIEKNLPGSLQNLRFCSSEMKFRMLHRNRIRILA